MINERRKERKIKKTEKRKPINKQKKERKRINKDEKERKRKKGG